MACMICLALTAADFEENHKALSHYRPWIRLAELRLDRLAPENYPGAADFMNRMKVEHDISFILTIRTIEDGGVWAFGEAARRSLMRQVIGGVEAGVLAYVDLEMDRTWPEVEEVAALAGARIIRSCHNFSGTPENLATVLPEQYRTADDVVKAAVMVRGMADLTSLAGLAAQLKAQGRPFILVGMGPYGIASRILAGRLGSLLTFASSSLQGHVAAAPGHMDPQMLAEQFGYYNISQATRIFGIIGNPVLHSRSPAFHNRIFQEKDLDAVYLPFQVDELGAFFQLAELLPISGCSVTIPHKEGVLPFLGAMDASVRQIGACNTMVRRDFDWYGTNTDAPGFFLPLQGLLAGRHCQRAVVIGAGGASRAIVQALLSNGYRILLLNRSVERARSLQEDFALHYPDAIEVEALPDAGAVVDQALVERIRSWAQVMVQTTSVGMEGHGEDHDPLWFYPFGGSEFVYDIIYTPSRTAFLKRAESAGCPVLNGWPMFEQQALLQSKLFIRSSFN